MQFWQIILAVLGTNGFTIFVTLFVERKKRKLDLKKEEADIKHISADEIKLLAEARRINADTENTISEGWKHVADSLKTERDKALERIADLERMLEEEERLSIIKQEKIKAECNNLIYELREQLKIERDRYDNRISEIVKQILQK